MSLSDDIKTLLAHSPAPHTMTASTGTQIKVPRDVIEGIINFVLADGLYDSEYLKHEGVLIRIVELPDPVILEYENPGEPQ